MTKKHFWQTSSNWGFLTGIFLFAMNLVSWMLKLEANGHDWAHELLLFLVICPVIIISARRNAAAAGPEGYSYGRAVGFVFATMMFAGIIYGVGLFLMFNFIAVDYYIPMLEKSSNDFISGMAAANPALTDQAIEIWDLMIRIVKNPFVLIFIGMLYITAKGGILGLVLCAFLYRKPDIFAQQIEDDESGSE